MLAARLKNIFFSLLAVEIVSSTFSFILLCYLIHNHRETFGEDTARPLFCLVALFLFSLMNFIVVFYQKVVRFSSFDHSITWGGFFKAQISLAIMALIFICFAEAYVDRGTSLAIVGYTLLSMFLISTLYIITSQTLRGLYNLPTNKLRVLVVGMNDRTKTFCTVLRNTPHLGAEVRGYLDDRETESPVPYFGDTKNLGVILRREVIDIVFIFLPVRSFYDTIQLIIETSAFYGVTSYIVGNVFEADNIKKHPLCINDFGSMAFSSTTVDYLGLAAKRILDALLSATALVITAPRFSFSSSARLMCTMRL